VVKNFGTKGPSIGFPVAPTPICEPALELCANWKSQTPDSMWGRSCGAGKSAFNKNRFKLLRAQARNDAEATPAGARECTRRQDGARKEENRGELNSAAARLSPDGHKRT